MKKTLALVVSSVLASSPLLATESEELEIPEITVLGVAGADKKSVQDFVPTISEISGRKLDKKRAQTLGETLSRETGVTSTQFGPGSSRPVIRALDGDRIRVLQGGLGTLDASGTSADHAVAGDPLLIDRVEIIRGSGALLYGSSAIGGVVNTVSSRIPTRLQYDSKIKFDSRFSTVDAGRTLGLLVNHSAGDWAYHFDGILRASGDYRTPIKTVANSEAETLEGALGVSRITDNGYWGASFSSFGTHYGVVKEEETVIDLNRQRLDFAGEFKTGGWIESGRVAGALSTYKHTESGHDHHALVALGGGDDEEGTVFKNTGGEFRADLRHRPWGAIQGIVGLQTQAFRLSARGEEAFLPTTNNVQGALFAFEELSTGNWTHNFGLRGEYSRVNSLGGGAFGAEASRSFLTPSVSLGTLYRLSDVYSLGLNTSFTERAPNYQELFALGQHMATSTYEIGNSNLEREIGRSAELSLRRKQGKSEARATLFVQDFTRFIGLIPNGATDVDSGFAEYEFRPISAVLYGAEFELREQLPWTLFDGIWELETRLDVVRGFNRTDRTFLPRVTPVRETVGLSYRGNAVAAEIEIQRSEAQTQLAANEQKTPAFTMLNLGAEMPVTTSFGALRLTARLNNALNVEARNHVSFVKDVAPLPGRNFIVGLQARL
jgi:iron complex outermembrane receptor protein